MNERIKKLKRNELRIRRLVNTHFAGEFRSVFKGAGLDFDAVRTYQYGDDVRHIDWNVSAKGHGTFVKTFREDRGQTVFLVLDVSGSQRVGGKLDQSRELLGTLALSAISDGSHVGLLTFSDVREQLFRPQKGAGVTNRLLRCLFETPLKSRNTDLEACCNAVLGLLPHRSVVVWVSDFLASGYERSFRVLAKKHDLIAVRMMNKREEEWPNLGIVRMKDSETGRVCWVNSSTKQFRQDNILAANLLEEQFKRLCHGAGASLLSLNAEEDFVDKMAKFFRHRNRVHQ